PLLGKVDAPEKGPSTVEIDSPVAGSAQGRAIASFTVDEISEGAAAKFLGAKPKTYKHVKGGAVYALDPELGHSLEAQAANTAPAPQQPAPRRPQPPPLGGKP